MFPLGVRFRRPFIGYVGCTFRGLVQIEMWKAERQLVEDFNRMLFAPTHFGGTDE